MLVAVAERLRSVLRAIDDVFRVGGDEFAVLLPGVAFESDDAEQLCLRVVEAVSAPLSGGQHAGRCQLSPDPPIGVGGRGRWVVNLLGVR